jgi:Kef-type K+ transport system membrane component KefB/nucleotide-binding universal stress UspA family protein
MENITLALALLLTAGFLAAKLGQLFRLPSVTGYIVAGLLLGPSGLGLVSGEMIDEGMGHFTQIALMLITFGIGEHLELKRLRKRIKELGAIGGFEVTTAFVLVAVVIYGSSRLFLAAGWQNPDFLILAILLGAVAVATAPASTLHVMREVKAAGPLTSTLLAAVAVNNGLAIMLFGLAVSAAHHWAAYGQSTLLQTISGSIADILLPLLLGVAAGLLIDFTVNRLRHRGEMLTIGLALLLLGGEAARLLGFSPLLTGMAAGFTLVNRDIRDVRLFRQLNRFEPPIFVLFFTLAGAHLDLSALVVAGWLGLIYFLARAAGKIFGAGIGARIAGASRGIRENLGLALLPQAGVAIGLAFLIADEPSLRRYATVITPVVLASVFLSELIGPVAARLAVERAGEARDGEERAGMQAAAGKEPPPFELVPWTWKRLRPTHHPQGVVIFGAAHVDTVAGLARMATLLAHSYNARPLAVRVLPPENRKSHEGLRQENAALFAVEEQEVRKLGYALHTRVVQAREVAAGLLEVAGRQKTWAIVLGHPGKATAQDFRCVVEAVAIKAPCPVIVVRLAGVLHTERILVPVASTGELETVRDVVLAFSGVGRHRVKLFYLLPSDADEKETGRKRQQLEEWADREHLTPFVRCRVVATEARLEAIIREAADHDILVMAAGQTQGLQKLFFGSLAEAVAQKCAKPLLMVHPGGKAE